MGAIPKDVVRPVGAELALRGAYGHGIVVTESTARRFHFSKAFHQIKGDDISTELEYINHTIVNQVNGSKTQAVSLVQNHFS